MKVFSGLGVLKVPEMLPAFVFLLSVFNAFVFNFCKSSVAAGGFN